MGRYSFHVGLFHPLLHAGFNRRSLRVPGRARFPSHTRTPDSDKLSHVCHNRSSGKGHANAFAVGGTHETLLEHMKEEKGAEGEAREIENAQ